MARIFDFAVWMRLCLDKPNQLQCDSFCVSRCLTVISPSEKKRISSCRCEWNTYTCALHACMHVHRLQVNVTSAMNEQIKHRNVQQMFVIFQLKK